MEEVDAPESRLPQAFLINRTSTVERGVSRSLLGEGSQGEVSVSETDPEPPPSAAREAGKEIKGKAEPTKLREDGADAKPDRSGLEENRTIFNFLHLRS